MSTGLTFNAPQFLTLLWAIPLLIVLVVIGLRKARRDREAFTRLWPHLTTVSDRRRNIVAAVAILTIALLSIALARPSWSAKTITVQQRARDVVFVVDVSRSMLAEDILPNRLARAKLAIKDVLPELEGDRVAVVAFAGDTLIICPLTRDYQFVRWAVDRLDPGLIPQGGTLIGDAVRTVSDEVFDPTIRRRKDVILISDGEDQGSFPTQAAATAAQDGLRLLTIGLGDPEQGARIPVETEEGGRTYLTSNGREVWTRLHPQTLRDMATSTPGGRYLNAGTGAFDLGAIYRDIAQGEDGSQLGEAEIVRHEDRFQLFVLIAILLLIARMIVSEAPSGSAASATLGRRVVRSLARGLRGRQWAPVPFRLRRGTAKQRGEVA